MRRKTVRTGLRFMISAVLLLLLGTFYSQQVNTMFSLPADGAFEFVKLAFLWSLIFGVSGVIIFVIGLIRRAAIADRINLLPSFILLILLIAVFFTLFYRTPALPQIDRPLKPGETLII
ncbi:MAG: hypothetical protein HXX17_00880 [Geobacteraceae bacterium]|nr:hypothetical protein [Geobacteraceae bacterium]